VEPDPVMEVGALLLAQIAKMAEEQAREEAGSGSDLQKVDPVSGRDGAERRQKKRGRSPGQPAAVVDQVGHLVAQETGVPIAVPGELAQAPVETLRQRKEIMEQAGRDPYIIENRQR
jgi:hypothetical protein